MSIEYSGIMVGMRVIACFTALIGTITTASDIDAPPAGVPVISSLLKPAIYKRAREDREIMSYARLEDADRKTGTSHYSYYAVTSVAAPLKLVRDTIVDFPVYPKMIPYVHKVDYNPARKSMIIEGGIWKFKMISTIEMEEKNQRWFKYRVVAGHFKGLEGDLIFEDLSERGTLVYLSGSVQGREWPPKLILERGAEIVFGYTARRMRSYVEEFKQNGASERKRDERGEIPQPGRKL